MSKMLPSTRTFVQGEHPHLLDIQFKTLPDYNKSCLGCFHVSTSQPISSQVARQARETIMAEKVTKIEEKSAFILNVKGTRSLWLRCVSHKALKPTFK